MTSPDDRTTPYTPDPVAHPTTQKRRRRWPFIAGGIVLIVAIAVAWLGAMALDDNKATPKPAAAVALPVDDCGGGICATTATSPEPEHVTAEPQASDVHLKLQITEKQCFGSAGCVMTAKVKMTYSGPDVDPDGTWEITYEIKGGESGPIIGSFDMMGDRTYEINEESLSTTSSKTKPSVKVTGLEKLGV